MASARSLGSLTLDLILKMGGFEQGMDKAARTTDKRMREMEQRAYKFGQTIGKGLKLAGAALATGAAIAATALIASTKAAIDNADAIRDLSVRTGVGTETLSAYGYAASQTGTDIETLGKGLRVLSKNAADAQNATSEQAKVFEALGVSVTDADGKLKSLGVLVPEIANKFAQLEDGTTKAALAQALFGRAGGELTEFLNSGADGLDEFTRKAKELGIVIDQDTANAADQFNDTLGDLKAIVSGVGLQIASGLLPALNDGAKSLKEMAQEGDLANNIVTVLSATFRAGVGALDAYNRAVQVTSAAIETIVNASEGFAEIQRNIGIGGAFDEGSMVAGAEKVRLAFEEGDKALERIHNRSKSLFANVQSSVTGAKTAGDADLERRLGLALSNPSAPKAGKKAGKTDAERDAERLQKAYESLNERLAEQVALFGSTGEAAKLRYDLENGELSKLTQAQKDNLLVQAEAYDQMVLMQDLEEAAAETVKRESEAFDERMKSNEQLIKDMQFELELLGMTNSERERSIALSYLSADATDEQREAVANLAEELRNATEAEENWNQLQDSISNGLYDIISGAESAGDAIKNFLDDLNAQILKNITDDWAESLTDWFKNFASGSGSSGGGGFWSSILGAFGFGGGRAGGGTTRPFSATRVNEVGFEMATVNGNDYLLTGSQPVNVTSSNQVPRGGTTVVNMTVQGRIDKRSEARIAREISVRQRMAMVGA